eukprot:Colp12_sorted_trinity150504_noHs@23491
MIEHEIEGDAMGSPTREVCESVSLDLQGSESFGEIEASALLQRVLASGSIDRVLSSDSDPAVQGSDEALQGSDEAFQGSDEGLQGSDEILEGSNDSVSVSIEDTSSASSENDESEATSRPAKSFPPHMSRTMSLPAYKQMPSILKTRRVSDPPKKAFHTPHGSRAVRFDFDEKIICYADPDYDRKSDYRKNKKDRKKERPYVSTGILPRYSSSTYSSINYHTRFGMLSISKGADTSVKDKKVVSGLTDTMDFLFNDKSNSTPIVTHVPVEDDLLIERARSPSSSDEDVPFEAEASTPSFASRPLSSPVPLTRKPSLTVPGSSVPKGSSTTPSPSTSPRSISPVGSYVTGTAILASQSEGDMSLDKVKRAPSTTVDSLSARKLLSSPTGSYTSGLRYTTFGLSAYSSYYNSSRFY